MRFLIRALTAAMLGSAVLIPAMTHATSTRVNLPVISATLTGKSISVNGNLQSGAVNIRTNTTGEGFGEPLLIHLHAGVTVQQVFADMAKPAFQDPNTVSSLGAIVADAGVPHGTFTFQTVLLPGQYIALDAANNNAPPKTWPRTTFVITRAASPAALPAAQATIHIIDFRFRMPATLHAGEVVRVYNNGYLVHMADALGARSLQDAEKIASLLRAGKDKQAQRVATHNFISFAGPLSHNGMQQFRVPPMTGWYVMTCFMDTQDHREHARLGMLRIFRVVR
ncbi:MAG: hypothetical protein ACRDFX_03420 [Chloroflexota bacterium]